MVVSLLPEMCSHLSFFSCVKAGLNTVNWLLLRSSPSSATISPIASGMVVSLLSEMFSPLSFFICVKLAGNMDSWFPHTLSSVILFSFPTFSGIVLSLFRDRSSSSNSVNSNTASGNSSNSNRDRFNSFLPKTVVSILLLSFSLEIWESMS